MAKSFALIGNPNSGKTTIFNALTGSTQYVGNWPGVTVEKKEGRLLKNPEVVITDLPGIYSLSPYSPEEVVSRRHLLEDRPDVIIDIIDASSIERSLYLTTQLIELEIPMVVILNMMDVAQQRGIEIDAPALEKELGCPVFLATASKNRGIQEAAEAALKISGEKSSAVHAVFSGYIEHALAHIMDELKESIPDARIRRYYAIKLFEKDEVVQKTLPLPDELKTRIDLITADCEARLDDDGESLIITARYDYIEGIVSRCVSKKGNETATQSDRIDRILTGRFTAIPIFALIMFLIYYISVTTLGAWGNELLGEVFFPQVLTPWLVQLLEGIQTAPWLIALITDGIVAGVGAVLGFLPQIAILFLLLSFLEDCGYMSRIAFITDRILRRFGLSGKSIIPMLIGTGCSVPAIMSSRTIENERDRKITIFTASFVPCSAKIPIIGLIAGALFGGAFWVAPSAYFIGVLSVLISGVVLKKLGRMSKDESPFIMELPAYHLPSLKNLFRHTWERVSSFVKKAGTVILLSSVIIWFLSNFSLRFQMCPPERSILAALGSLIAPLFSPLGFGDWPAVVATITGLAAKENIVGTLSVLYGLAEGAEGAVLGSVFTPLSGYSFLLFNLLCIPCVAAVGAMMRELNSFRWSMAAVTYQTVYAYLIALIVYQGGLFIQTGRFTMLTAIALLALLALLWLVIRPQKAQGGVPHASRGS